MEEYQQRKVVSHSSSLTVMSSIKNKNPIVMYQLLCLDPFDAENTFEEIQRNFNIFKNTNYCVSIENFFFLDPETIIFTYPFHDDCLESILYEQNGELLSFEDVVDYCFQMSLGLLWMFQNNQIHGILTPKNVKLKNNQLLLSGFYVNGSMVHQGSKWNPYLAPGKN
jgi:hypothetical protein